MNSGFVSEGSCDVYFQTAGEGPAVLFIHAGVADSRMWRDQMGLEGYRTIAFDQRGFGRTKWLPGPYSNRNDALAILDHVGVDEAVVVGCSNGGEAALQLAIVAPERVAGLVLVGAAPGVGCLMEAGVTIDLGIRRWPPPRRVTSNVSWTWTHRCGSPAQDVPSMTSTPS